MVETADLFFKTNNAVVACMERRAKHVETSQKRHAEAVLKFNQTERSQGEGE